MSRALAQLRGQHSPVFSSFDDQDGAADAHVICDCGEQNSLEHLFRCRLVLPLLPMFTGLGHRELTFAHLFHSPHLVILMLLLTKRIGPHGQLSTSQHRRHHRRRLHPVTFEHRYAEFIPLIALGSLWPHLREMTTGECEAALIWLKRDDVYRRKIAS